jgi:hypothetical protein
VERDFEPQACAECYEGCTEPTELYGCLRICARVNESDFANAGRPGTVEEERTVKIDVESCPSLPDGVVMTIRDRDVPGLLSESIPVPQLAPALAIEQSTGTWVAVPGEPEVRRCHVAKVIGV